MTRWDEAMRAALAEARAATAHGDVPVGAIILDTSGAVVASGHNERELVGDPTAHAEIVAIRRAAQALGEWRLVGCTLVVTLEPCLMCAGAITASRVERVVFGPFDDKGGGVSSLFDLVRDPRLNHRVEVVAGVLADDGSAVLREFFRGEGGASDEESASSDQASGG